MRIYIASSWKNQHAVEMFTELLEQRGHEVVSFVRAAVESEGRDGMKFDFEQWINSDDGKRKFDYDANGATTSDIVIYIGPSGKDAAAECGMAWAQGIPIIGLYAKGEDFGLMRRMMSRWCRNYLEVLGEVDARQAVSC